MSAARAVRLRTLIAALGVACLLAPAAPALATGAAAPPAGAATAPTTVGPVGTTYASAASSCWQIKQLTPSAPSGAYWINTPQLIDPVRIYCDQTTSGGGWELLGRGRNDWQWSAVGQGDPASIYTTPSGTGAFATASLSDATVDGLLGGGRVDALPDGVQLRRTTDPAGTTVQTATLSLADRATWSWAFNAGERLTSATFPAGTTSPGATNEIGKDTGYNALVSETSASHDYAFGFGFGNSVVGTNSSTSYLWSYDSEGCALPFTQVWIRPELGTLTYPAIPAGGSPATSVTPRLNNTVQPAPWGVTGLARAYAGEQTMQVETFKQIGSTMFVGGLFTTVQNSAGTQKVAQPYLAGFNVNTGGWVSTFLPKLNGEVWTLTQLPDGNLLAGGEFTTANGAAAAGLVELNPATGATVSGTNVGVGGSLGRVRSLSQAGGYLYVGGSFTQFGPPNGRIAAANIGRISLRTGAIDKTWVPNIDGQVYELFASPQGDRVYVVGRFDTVNGAAQADQTTLSTSGSGTQVPGLQPWVPSTGSGGNTYQQTTLEAGPVVWQGGSQHILTAYNRSDYSQIRSWITKGTTGDVINGGDIQRTVLINGILYASCHCGQDVYSDTDNYSDPISTSDDVNRVDWMFAVDAGSYQVDPTFYIPDLGSAHGNGVWAMTQDSNHCLWFGGDLYSAGRQWLGSFGRTCSRDTTPPSAPTGLRVASTSIGPALSWTASKDNSGVAPQYEVLHNGQVVALTSATSYTDTGQTSGTYNVRAIDATGNRSASTPGINYPTTPPAGLAAGAYQPLTPARILDTRTGIGAPAARLASRQTVPLTVEGRGGVPDTGVAAVVLNLTAVAPGSGGYLTAYPAGSPQPPTSNLNYAAGQTVANLVTVPVGSGGQVDVFAGGGPVDVAADVAGYYVAGTPQAGGAFQALTPARIMDTRTGNGAPVGPVAPGATVSLQVAGRGGVPSSGASAVVLNVTVADTSAGGYVTAYPAVQGRPPTSNVNFGAGAELANLVTVPLGQNGQVELYVSGARLDLVADVFGYYRSGAAGSTGMFTPLTSPARLLDTRSGLGGPGGALRGGVPRALTVVGAGGVPASGVSGAVVNLTVVKPSVAGYLEAYPAAATAPVVSNINYARGQTLANLSAVSLSTDGQIDLVINTGTADAVADVFGYFRS